MVIFKKKGGSTKENKCISNFADLFKEELVKMVNFYEPRNLLKAIKYEVYYFWLRLFPSCMSLGVGLQICLFLVFFLSIYSWLLQDTKSHCKILITLLL